MDLAQTQFGMYVFGRVLYKKVGVTTVVDRIYVAGCSRENG